MKKLLTLLVLLVAIVTGAKADDVLLKSVDFTNTTNFPATTYGGSSATTQTVYGVFIVTKNNKSIKVNNTTPGVDFNGANMSSNDHGVAIPVTGVNGKLTVKVYHSYNNTSANFKVGISHEKDNDPSKSQTWDQSPTNSGTKNKNDFTYTKSGLSGTDYIVWVGESGTSYTVVKKVEIYTEASAGPVDPTFTLSANEVEVDKTISVNGPAGLEFTATPVGGTTGAVSVSGGTITGVTAGAAQVRVTSDATSEYNVYDHTFDITVTAAKIATELSFGTPTATVARGEEVTNAATLTAGGSPIEGTITYSSADETIATVDATGKVTGKKTGTTSIKANYAGDATYSAAEEVSYDITVTLPALTPVSDTKWTSASLLTAAGGAKDYNSADVLDNLEIVGTSTALKIATGNNKTIDGETFGGRVKFGKDGSTDGNYVHFKVTPNSQITMWGIRATAGAEENGLALSFGAFGENEIIYSFKAGDVEFINYNYTGSEDIDVYAYSKNTNGASMMEIKVAPIQSQTIHVGETGFATIGLPFATVIPDGVTAYAVTAVNEGKVTVSEPIVAGTEVPGNKGYIIVGNGNTNYEFTSIGTATASTNLLEAVGATPKAATTEAPIYVLTVTGEKKVGFKKATTGSLGAYKAYLPGTVSNLTSLSVSFDEETAINGIAESGANAEAPVKVIKNGQLFIGNYNVAGARIK